MIPIIAAILQAGLPILAGAVATKGKDYIQEKLGVDITSALGTEDGKIRLKQLEFEHEDFLLNLALQKQELDMKNDAMYLADVDSARDRETAIATAEHAPYINKVITPYLALGVLGLTFGLFALIMFGDSTVTPARKDIIIYILGVLSAISTQIVSYYFGSSRSSSTKDETINLMQKAV